MLSFRSNSVIVVIALATIACLWVSSTTHAFAFFGGVNRVSSGPLPSMVTASPATFERMRYPQNTNTQSHSLPYSQLKKQRTQNHYLPRSVVVLHLEKWVADMIDDELWRQEHKKEFERQWMDKNRAALLRSLNADSSESTSSSTFLEEDYSDFRQHAKDVQLARSDPQRYCADRCIATGHCDVYEDFFNMPPSEVIAFCKDCVVSEGDDPCDIPDAFYENIEKLKP